MGMWWDVPHVRPMSMHEDVNALFVVTETCEEHQIHCEPLPPHSCAPVSDAQLRFRRKLQLLSWLSVTELPATSSDTGDPASRAASQAKQ